ncbi:MAG TPA: hypothetical protein PKV84_01595 [Candidatus Omnitrophota bacterium]|nr:hypothetical protein [Candidatus Omnitrophota bacterium]
MKRLYTKFKDIYVLTDPGDLTDLKLDSCVVARKGRQVYVAALESLQSKCVEDKRSSGYSDPVFGFYAAKPERFLVINGERKTVKFCDLCKDRLHGITGNCFSYGVKPGGCSFRPANALGKFNISLDGWRYLKPSRVNHYSPFKKPWSAEYIRLDSKVISRNKRAIAARNDFWNQLEKKKKKYCSRCIFGRCRMNSMRIAERCMVTDEKTQKRCIKKIQGRFGSVEEFLNRLAFCGKEIACRPHGEKRKTKWVITKPVGRNKFLIRKRSRPFKRAVVSRARIEGNVIPGALPWEGREKIASLAWYFFERYYAKDQDAYRGYRGRTIRILSLTPIPEGIKISYYPYGWGTPEILEKQFYSFNEVVSFER